LKDKINIQELFKLYRDGNLTEQQWQELQERLKNEANQREWNELAAHSLLDPVNENLQADDQIQQDLNRVADQLYLKIKPVTLRKRLPFYYSAAAAILVMLGFLYYFHKPKIDSAVVEPMHSEFGTDAKPGGNRAWLTFKDGSKISLDEHQDEIISKEVIHYVDGGLIADNIKNIIRKQPSLSDSITLHTPAAGQYKVTLADGTKVLLNASSSITYPIRFSGANRSVKLSGEAFFDVKSSKEPFEVLSENQKITVLGTTFNVYAYPDERVTETTLVKGQVKIRNTSSNKEFFLKPNQQLHIQGEKSTLSQVQVDPFIAWTKGVFQFKDTDMYRAMAQISRWYNVKVWYQKDIPNTTFFGEVDRDKSLSQVLKLLKRSGLNFSLEEKNNEKILTVLP